MKAKLTALSTPAMLLCHAAHPNEKLLFWISEYLRERRETPLFPRHIMQEMTSARCNFYFAFHFSVEVPGVPAAGPVAGGLGWFLTNLQLPAPFCLLLWHFPHLHPYPEPLQRWAHNIFIKGEEKKKSKKGRKAASGRGEFLKNPYPGAF